MANLNCGGQTVTIGRIVHYCDNVSVDNPAILPALIVRVNPEKEAVSLRVFGLSETEDRTRHWVKYSEKSERGCWNWPPRV